MGSIPQLPMFQPQQVQVQPGPHPQPYNAPPGTMPYATNPAADLVGGINSFVQNFVGMKQAREQSYKTKFMEGIQQKMLGLPVDDEKLMQYAQKGGLNLKTTAPTPEELAYQNQQKQVSQGDGNAMAAMVGPGGQMQPPGGQPPPMAPPQQPGGMRGMLAGVQRGMGMGQPPVSMNSPTGQWLQQLTDAVKMGGGLPGQIAQREHMSTLEDKLKEKGIDLSSMTMDQQKNMLMVAKAGMTGDPQALEMMSRSGVWKDMPGDEISRMLTMASPEMDPSQVRQQTGKMMLWLQGGGPQMQIKMLDMAKDMAPRFGGDMQATLQYLNNPAAATQQPGFTPTEFEQLSNAVDKLHNISPTAPPNLLMYGGLAAVTGKKDVLDRVMTTLSDHYPTSGDIAQKNFDVTSGQKKTELAQGQQRIGLEAQRNQIDRDSLGLRTEIERGNLNLSQLKAISEGAGEQGKLAWDILNNKDSGAEEKQSALDMLASAIDKKAQIKVNYGGQSYTLADPVKRINEWKANPGWWGTGGKPQLQLVAPPAGSMGQAPPMPGAPPTPGAAAPTPQALQNWQQKMTKSFEGLDPVEKMLMIKKLDKSGMYGQADPQDQILQYLIQNQSK